MTELEALQTINDEFNTPGVTRVVFNQVHDPFYILNNTICYEYIVYCDLDILKRGRCVFTAYPTKLFQMFDNRFGVHQDEWFGFLTLTKIARAKMPRAML